jgi:hypothetical protein
MVCIVDGTRRFLVRRATTMCASSNILLAAFILLLPSSVSAQSDSGRNELTVFAGVSLGNPAATSVDFAEILGGVPQIFPAPFTVTSTVLDGSAEFGARYTRTLSDLLSLSGDFSIAPGHQLTETVSFECPPGICIAANGISLVPPDVQISSGVEAYHYGVNIGVDLAQGPVRPTDSAGFGGVTFDTETRADTSFALRVGGGLRVDHGRVVTRIEVIDVITADHPLTSRSEHDVHVRVGFGVRW